MQVSPKFTDFEKIQTSFLFFNLILIRFMEKANSTASSSGQEISEKEDREKGNLDTTASVEDSDVERPTGLETANISGDEIRNKPDSEIDEGGFWGWSTVAGA